MQSDVPTLLTYKQFHERHQGFPENTLKWLWYRSRPRVCRINGEEKELPGNGFASAFKKVGGHRVMVDEAEFFRVIEIQNQVVTAERRREHEIPFG